MGFFDWFAKENSPSVEESENIIIEGSNNVVGTQHLAHLENINLGVSVIAVILVLGIVFFSIKKCLRCIKQKHQRQLQKAIAQGL